MMPMMPNDFTKKVNFSFSKNTADMTHLIMMEERDEGLCLSFFPGPLPIPPVHVLLYVVCMSLSEYFVYDFVAVIKLLKVCDIFMTL